MSRIRLALSLAALAACSDRNATREPGESDAMIDSESADAPPAPLHLAGINFPPTQGTSNAGAFLPGIYDYSYSDAQIGDAGATFNIMRLPINVATANDPASLAKLRSYVDALGGRAILCMFDTTDDPTNAPHADGRADVTTMGPAWATIHAGFAGYPDVRYEIFNEPFGYDRTDPIAYVNEMKAIIAAGGLPESKCIIDGLGYADDVRSVAAHWTGDLGYHFYPNWSSDHTQSAYSNLVQTALGELAPRTWITEFGAALGHANDCYETFIDGMQPASADINALRGLDDALRALRANGGGIKAAFFWHGWHNGDSYDFWSPANETGACKVRMIEANN